MNLINVQRLYPLPCDEYRRKGQVIDGTGAKAALERHRKCCGSDASSMQRASSSDVSWTSHSGLSSVSYTLSCGTNRVCMCARFYACVCMWARVCSFHSSICYLLFYRSVCITGKSLIFLSCRWMMFDLFKNCILWLLSDNSD